METYIKDISNLPDYIRKDFYRIGRKRGNSSKYIGVAIVVLISGKTRWHGQFLNKFSGKVGSKTFDTEREAALFVDKARIRLGEEPVNILKRV